MTAPSETKEKRKPRRWFRWVVGMVALVLVVGLCVSIYRPMRILTQFDGGPVNYHFTTTTMERQPAGLASPGLTMVASGVRIRFPLFELLTGGQFTALKLIDPVFHTVSSERGELLAATGSFWKNRLRFSSWPAEMIVLENARFRREGFVGFLPFEMTAMRNPSGALEIVLSTQEEALQLKARGRMGWDRLENRLTYEGIWDRTKPLGILQDLEDQLAPWLVHAFSKVGIQGAIYFGPEWHYSESLHLLAGQCEEWVVAKGSFTNMIFSAAYSHQQDGNSRIRLEGEANWTANNKPHPPTPLRFTLQQVGSGPYRLELFFGDSERIQIEADSLSANAPIRIQTTGEGLQKSVYGHLSYTEEGHPYLTLETEDATSILPEDLRELLLQ